MCGRFEHWTFMFLSPSFLHFWHFSVQDLSISNTCMERHFITPTWLGSGDRQAVCILSFLCWRKKKALYTPTPHLSPSVGGAGGLGGEGNPISISSIGKEGMFMLLCSFLHGWTSYLPTSTLPLHTPDISGMPAFPGIISHHHPLST